jgi:hypothetical protein
VDVYEPSVEVFVTAPTTMDTFVLPPTYVFGNVYLIVVPVTVNVPPAGTPLTDVSDGEPPVPDGSVIDTPLRFCPVAVVNENV